MEMLKFNLEQDRGALHGLWGNGFLMIIVLGFGGTGHEDNCVVVAGLASGAFGVLDSDVIRLDLCRWLPPATMRTSIYSTIFGWCGRHGLLRWTRGLLTPSTDLLSLVRGQEPRCPLAALDHVVARVATVLALRGRSGSHHFAVRRRLSPLGRPCPAPTLADWKTQAAQ